MEKRNGSLQKLFELIATLRGENGCPWDRAQKTEDILADLVEEVYELQWAHGQQSRDEILDEAGDVVFVLVFALLLLEEQDPSLTLENITSHAHAKITRRHPHVFGDEVARSQEEGLAHWNRMKAEENKQKGTDGDIFTDVPGSLSPVRKAEKLQKRAARVGFDWPNTDGIIKKIREELTELDAVTHESSRERAEEELGDLLFSVLNLTRFLNIDGEKALNAANTKFVSRFRHMERLATADGHALDNLSLEEMDIYWERAKKAE